MNLRLLGGFTLTALLTSVGAQAATLAGLHGEVLINRGGGYLPATTESTDLEPGNQVMAQPNSGGEITYADGCKVQLAPGEVVAIGEHSPCAIETGSIPKPGPFGGITGTQILIGVAVVGGGVGLAVALGNNHNNSNPASP